MTKLKRKPVDLGQVQVQGHTRILLELDTGSLGCVSEASCIHPVVPLPLSLFRPHPFQPPSRCQDQTWPAIRRYHAALLFPYPCPYPFLFRSTTPLLHTH
jgi:hypothetical protein